MSLSSVTVRQRLETVFNKRQAEVLAEVIDFSYNDLVKVSDFSELKGIVRELAEAQKRTEARVEELAEAQKRTEARVEELAEAQKRTEARVEELAEAQKRTEARVEELAEAQKRTEARVEELAEAQKRTEIRVEELAAAQKELAMAQKELTVRQRTMQDMQASMRGDLLEIRYRNRAAAYLGRQLRRVKSFLPAELEDIFEERLDPEAYYDLLETDLVVRGRLRQGEPAPEVWLVMEISAVVDRHDVERAMRRAERLRQAGFPALAVVVGEDITLGARTLADEHHVVTLLDSGRISGWDEAVSLALSSSSQAAA